MVRVGCNEHENDKIRCFSPDVAKIPIIDSNNSAIGTANTTGVSARPCCHLWTSYSTRGGVGRFQPKFWANQWCYEAVTGVSRSTIHWPFISGQFFSQVNDRFYDRDQNGQNRTNVEIFKRPVRSKFLRIFNFAGHIWNQRQKVHQKPIGNRTFSRKVAKRVTLRGASVADAEF